MTGRLDNAANQIWYGQMSDGSWVIGLFNRDDSSRSMGVTFADLGIAGTWNVRDLWKHTDEGSATAVSATVPAHGCKIVKLTK